MSNAKRDFDYGYIIVQPKPAGDFGMAFLSGVHYENDSHLIAMKRQIERHVDMGAVRIAYENNSWYCSGCGSYYDTEKEAEDCCMEENDD